MAETTLLWLDPRGVVNGQGNVLELGKYFVIKRDMI